MDTNIPSSVKGRNRTHWSTNPRPSIHVLGLHQEILQVDGWENFSNNGDKKNSLIVLSIKFLKSPENEEFHKYIVWCVIIYIRNYVRTFAYCLKT